MARELTRKQREFAARVIAGQNGTQAALEVYDTTDANTAAMIASENLTKPKIRAEIQKALQDQDISIKDGLAVIKDALTANHGDKEDWGLRLTAAEKVLKLHHAYDGIGENGPKQSHAHLHLEISEVNPEIRSWVAGFFRQFRARPGLEEFRATFNREPSEAENRLLEPEKDH